MSTQPEKDSTGPYIRSEMEKIETEVAIAELMARRAEARLRMLEAEDKIQKLRAAKIKASGKEDI